jgi:iron complex transport system substrate-binding protein
MDNKILAIIVVAIIVVAGCSVALLTMNNNAPAKDDTVTATVEIYGNANNDAYIDDKDVSLLNDIIKTGNWDTSKYPFADADLDGFITSKDVDIVNKIIKEQSCKVYYKNYYGQSQALDFPLKGKNIGVTYWQQAEMMAALGLWDLVKCGPTNLKSWYSNLYDLSDVTIYTSKNNHNSGVTDSAIENFKLRGVEVIIATPTVANQAALATLIDEGVNVIYLWYTGDWAIPTMMTLGILLGAKEKAQAYYDYAHKVMDNINDRLSKTTRATAIVAGASTSLASDGVTTTVSLHTNPHEGNYYFTNLVTNTYTNSSGLSEFGATSRSIEWLMAHDSEFDHIAIWLNQTGFASGTATDVGGDGSIISQKQFNDKFEAAVKNYSQMSAYKNGNIFGMPYDMLGGISGYGLVTTLAYMVYPDLFTKEEAQDLLQEWFDNFTVAKIDVKTQGAYIYDGTAYKTNYNN